MMSRRAEIRPEAMARARARTARARCTRTCRSLSRSIWSAASRAVTRRSFRWEGLPDGGRVRERSPTGSRARGARRVARAWSISRSSTHVDRIARLRRDVYATSILKLARRAARERARAESDAQATAHRGRAHVKRRAPTYPRGTALRRARETRARRGAPERGERGRGARECEHGARGGANTVRARV
jgi:hypothetical protein